MPPFSPLIGQPQAVALLTQAVARERVAPAYLFAGPAGIGKSLATQCFVELLFNHAKRSNSATLAARIQQRNHPDLLWVEPTYLHQGKRFSATEATEAGIKRKSSPLIRLEQVREIGQFLSRSPLEASRFVVVLEQADTMPEAAANGLLKTLEEPGQATLILLASSVESLLPTLVSRCQRIPFYRLPQAAMAEVLQVTGHGEILEHPEILELAQGSPGAAIAHWQQLQELPADLLQGIAQPPQTHRQALSLARQIDKTVEPEAQRWLIDYLQQSYWQHQRSTLDTSTTALTSLQLLEKARQHLLRNVQPRLVWEVTLLGMVGESGVIIAP
jgi:DNA polymerase-3 subunit delta'